jgi:hypothetical protein
MAQTKSAKHMEMSSLIVKAQRIHVVVSLMELSCGELFSRFFLTECSLLSHAADSKLKEGDFGKFELAEDDKLFRMSCKLASNWVIHNQNAVTFNASLLCDRVSMRGNASPLKILYLHCLILLQPT